jgi:death on curing protein
MVRYLSAADLYVINEEIIGHRPLVRDRRLLRSAADRPSIRVFGEEQFPTLIDKAATLLHSIAYHHLFSDGNKRTAQQAVILFLEANGYQAIWQPHEATAFILEIAQGKHQIEAVSLWLADHTQAIDTNYNKDQA